MVPRGSVVVKMEHCRKAGYCARGVRVLSERHGLDYTKFLRDGIDSEELLAITGEDAMVLAAVEAARG